jgi:osmotically inducible lipoprotein OsmB
MRLQADSLSALGYLKKSKRGKTMYTLNVQHSASPLRLALAAVCLISLGACTNMPHTQQRVVSGAAVGAAAGIGVTAVTGGCITCGAAVGTVVGAGVGYVIDRANQ